MYLNRVKVENWRALREAVELDGLSPHLNVVYGPNETGKSTILDAVCRGFFDRHGTGGVDMETRQPWGGDLGPTVEIDFTVGDVRYRLFKKFLQGIGSQLRRHLAGGSLEKLSEGKPADLKILELVCGPAAAMAQKGMSKPEHWGLGQILWSCQGDATTLDIGDEQQARLRGALKITLDGTQGTALEAEVEKRYSAVFTEGGEFRKGQHRADVLRLEEELRTAEARVGELEQLRIRADQLEYELGAAHDAHAAVEARRTAARVDLDAARARLLALSEQKAAYERLEHDARQTQTAWDAQNAAAREIADADAAVAAAEAALRDAETARQQAQADQSVRQADAARAAEALDAARRRLAAGDEAIQSAERVAAYLGDRAAAAGVDRQIAVAEDLAARVAAAAETLRALRAPSAGDLRSLRALDRQRSELRARLDAASLTFVLTPERPLTDVAVTRDGAAQPAETIDGPRTLRAAATLAVTIAGVGRIDVRAGASDAVAVAADLARLDADWRGRVAAFAAADLSELEALHGERMALETDTGQWQAALAAGESVAALRDRRDALATQLRTLLADDPALAERTETPDAARAAAATLKIDRRLLADAVKSAEADVDRVRNAAAGADAAVQTAAGQFGHAKGLVAERRQRAAALRKADGLDDAARAAALAAALAAADAARQRLTVAARPPTESVGQEIQQLDRQAAAADAERTGLVSRIGQLEGQLDNVRAAALYSQWAEASERAESLRGQLAQARLNAEAIKLLWTTIKAHKQAVFEAVLGPVRHMVTTDLTALAGPRYDAVHFDSRLRPHAVRPVGRGADLAALTEHLSFGTREQLMLLVRLALARLLSPSLGRQCVILDDPLVNADAARQRAAVRLLEAAAQETQIIVFTCQPHAYASDQAKTFDLKAIVDAAHAPAVL